MKFCRLFPFFFILTLICFSASAQSVTVQKGDTRKSGNNTGLHASERGKMLGSTFDINSKNISYGQYTDEKFSELQKKMEEREWGSEDTAWKRACKINTKESYQKYIAMYPYGVHRPEADGKLVDLDVNDIFNSAHNDLPEMKHVESDDDSPTSTVVIENHTEYVMTVRYSGPESKVMFITPWGKDSITIKNGEYRIAASVPNAMVRPFAGTQGLCGGRYETGFIIVRR